MRPNQITNTSYSYWTSTHEFKYYMTKTILSY